MKNIVAIGELLIDFTCVSIDDDGYPTLSAHPGGAPANFLAVLSKFGAQTSLLGKVGKDSFGKMLIHTLKKMGTNPTGVIQDPNYFTTLAFVTLDQTGNREFSFSRKPGADTQLTSDDIQWELIDAADIFHFGTLSLTNEPSHTATKKAVMYAKKRGALISYDPNLRKDLWNDLDDAKDQMIWGLEQADIIKISEDEVHFLFEKDAQAGAEYILEQFKPKLVFVTCGENGCYSATPKVAGHIDSIPSLSVVDTTGAGDIFGGSALYALLESGTAVENLSWEQLEYISRFACSCAGLSTTKFGGISSIPEKKEVLSLMKKIYY